MSLGRIHFPITQTLPGGLARLQWLAFGHQSWMKIPERLGSHWAGGEPSVPVPGEVWHKAGSGSSWNPCQALSWGCTLRGTLGWTDSTQFSHHSHQARPQEPQKELEGFCTAFVAHLLLSRCYLGRVTRRLSGTEKAMATEGCEELEPKFMPQHSLGQGLNARLRGHCFYSC